MMKALKFLLFAIIVIDFIGINMVITLLPNFILNDQLNLVPINWSLSKRLMLIGVITALYPLGQFLGAPFWGTLSDQIGRKKALLSTLLLTCIGYAICSLAVIHHSLVFLSVGRLIIGFAAGNVAISLATMVDISEHHSKTANFTTIQTAIGVGLMLGASFAGFFSNSHISSWFNPALPFIILTGIILINITCVYFFLPNKALIQKIYKVRIKNPFQVLWKIRPFASRKLLLNTLFTWTLFIAGMTLLGLMLPPFLAAKYKLTSTDIASLLSFWGIVYTVAQLLLINPISRRYTSDILLKLLMIFPGIITLTMAYISNLPQLYIVSFFYAISLGFIMPNLFAVISDRAPNNQQGQVLGIASSIQGLMTVTVTLIGGFLLSINPNLITLTSGTLMCLAWIIYVRNNSRILP